MLFACFFIHIYCLPQWSHSMGRCGGGHRFIFVNFFEIESFFTKHFFHEYSKYEKCFKTSCHRISDASKATIQANPLILWHCGTVAPIYKKSLLKIFIYWCHSATVPQNDRICIEYNIRGL